jgi:rhomboid family GlyGly-CTERM serine protease
MWPALLALLACTLQVFGGSEAWRLERGLVLAEPWRLLTGHLVHVGWVHLVMNLAGAALVWLLVGRAFAVGQWAWVILICVVGTDIGLLAFSPGIEWYSGFSGVLHGIVVAGAIASLTRAPAIAALLLGALVLKLVFEQLGTDTTGTARLIGAPVIVDAHLYGALTGAAGALLVRTWRSRWTSAPR